MSRHLRKPALLVLLAQCSVTFAHIQTKPTTADAVGAAHIRTCCASSPVVVWAERAVPTAPGVTLRVRTAGSSDPSSPAFLLLPSFPHGKE